MEANWRPTQGSDPAGVDPNAPAGGDWRLQPEARSRVVNKILETLKKHLLAERHQTLLVPEELNELQKIAVRFEERIYTTATNQHDYVRKIYLKMIPMETGAQQAPGNAQVIPNQNNPGQGEALDEHLNPLLSLGIRHGRSRAPNNNLVINIVDTPETNILAVQALPEPVREVKEPKFSCPFCMNELVDASSTICGHIFCQKCIKAAIQAHKRCPNCGTKLNMNNFHRVYLPATDH